MRLLRSKLAVSDRARRTFTPKARARSGLLLSVVGLAMLAALRPAIGTALDTAAIEQLTGAKGKLDEKDGVFKVAVPRTDLSVTVAGVHLTPPMGLTSWAAFQPAGEHAMVMGDLVLLEDQVNPVMSTALDNGLQVTALHNHFFWDEPRMFYMHVHGHGAAADLAARLKPALDMIGKGAASPAPAAGPGALDTAKIAQIVGRPGDQMGSVYKITVGRDDLSIKEMGATINARMGLNTWAAFVGTNENAAIAGDVAMLAGEVTPVLKALRANGLQVVAIHHHMTDTSPTIFFLHYWGTGPAATLAAGFRAALDQLAK